MAVAVDAPSRRARSRRRRRPWWVRHRRALVVAAAALLLLLGLAAWFAVTARQAHAALAGVRAHLEQARAAVSAGDVPTARREVDLAAADAADARATTSALPWDLVAAAPVLGRPARTGRELAAAVDDLAVQVLRPAAGALDPAALRPAGGQVDVAALAAARAPLAGASAAAGALTGRVAAIPPAGFPAALDDARAELQAQVGELAGLLGTASTATTLLPPMLGADGPRSYLLAFQTNAEARGTAGLLGGYAVLTADRGRLALDVLASNRDLQPGRPPGIDLGPEYADQYAGYGSTTLWQNANSSPHFPYAARIWSSLWEQQTGQRLDGVVGVDPVALGHVLAVTGPVTLPTGEVIDAGNVVRTTMSEAYTRFVEDNDARKDYLQSIALAVADRLLRGDGGTGVLPALAQGAREGRLAVWSAVPAEQDVLATTPLGHVVPGTPAPYANVVVNNASANKLDYYLARSLRYEAGGCDTPLRQSRISVDFTNRAPLEPLPDYVAGRRERDRSGPPNTNRLLVSLYATAGATLRSVTVDGVPATARPGAELGHPVFTVNALVAPGATARVVFELVEPTAPGAPVVPVQPLVEPMAVRTAVPECGA